MPMQIGEYEIPYYPTGFTIPRPFRSNSYVETFTGVAHFSWGLFDAGQIIDIEWNYMPSEQFDALDAVYQDDEEVEWDPGISDLSTKYDVQILDFTGEFHEAVGTDTEIWRKNCRMQLLIIAEAA